MVVELGGAAEVDAQLVAHIDHAVGGAGEDDPGATDGSLAGAELGGAGALGVEDLHGAGDVGIGGAGAAQGHVAVFAVEGQLGGAGEDQVDRLGVSGNAGADAAGAADGQFVELAGQAEFRSAGGLDVRLGSTHGQVLDVGGAAESHLEILVAGEVALDGELRRPGHPEDEQVRHADKDPHLVAAAVLHAAADVTRQVADAEGQDAAADLNAQEGHQEVRRIHADGVARRLDKLDLVDPGGVDAVETIELVLLGFTLGVEIRLGNRPGGEGQDGDQHRCEKGEELFHFIGFF